MWEILPFRREMNKAGLWKLGREGPVDRAADNRSVRGADDVDFAA